MSRLLLPKSWGKVVLNLEMTYESNRVWTDSSPISLNGSRYERTPALPRAVYTRHINEWPVTSPETHTNAATKNDPDQTDSTMFHILIFLLLITHFHRSLFSSSQACLMMLFSHNLKKRYERSTNISVDHLLSIYSLHRKSKVFHAR